MQRDDLIEGMARTSWESVNTGADWNHVDKADRDGLCQQQEKALSFLESAFPAAQAEIRRWLRFEQFRIYGCIPQCLIQWSHLRGTSAISVSEFIDREADKYWSDTDRCGLATFPDQTLQIAQSLGIANNLGAPKDAASLRLAFNQGCGVLMFTTSPTNHCRLVMGWTAADEVVTWNPVNNRIDLAIPEVFTDARLLADGASFVVLVP